VSFIGELTCLATNERETYQVRQLQIDDLRSILSLQQEVLDTLDKKDSLQPLSTEEYKTILEGHGLMLGVFVKKQLIAFRALWFPGEDKENLGRDLGLSADEQMKVVHQEISIVHPDYRGNGLQKRLAVLVMEELESRLEEFQYVCCTVHPFNIPSLKDKFAQGLFIVQVKEKYTGQLRYILVKELQRETELDKAFTKSVALDDIKGQQYILDQGYYGYQLSEQNGQLSLSFALPVQ
jgi:ribosomal protein S18 acetylase RimI-like enzyme